MHFAGRRSWCVGILDQCPLVGCAALQRLTLVIVHRPPPSCCNSARCCLSLHPSCSVGLPHCLVPQHIVQMVVVLPLIKPLPSVHLRLSFDYVKSNIQTYKLNSFSPNLNFLLRPSSHCDSARCCLPPLPPPYPSQSHTMSSSPGVAPRREASPSGWCAVFRENQWRWLGQRASLRASCDNNLHTINVDYSTIYSWDKFW